MRRVSSGRVSGWCCLFLTIFGLSRVAPAATNRFEGEVRALELAATSKPVPPGGVVLYGSSSFRLWSDAGSRFPDVPLANLGFGGAQLSDLNEFFDRLVVPAAPRFVLVYGGDNDIAAGKSPERVLADFRELVDRVRRVLPKARVAFVAIKPSPSREGLLKAQQEANRKVRDFARTHRRVDFLDGATPMLDGEGRPDPRFFVKDRLHLNAAGYDRWVEVLNPYFDRWVRR